MKLLIQCEIEIEDDLWFDENYPEELEWFEEMLNDTNNTMIILHSNENGEISSTNKFKYKKI